MASDYDHLRHSQRDALERAGNEPEPNAKAARLNAQERVQSTAGPGAGMASSQTWAAEYNKDAQARQAELHAAQKAQAQEQASPSEPQIRPTERDKIEARKGLTAEHETARQASDHPSQDPDAIPEQEKQDINAYRRASHEVKDRERDSEPQLPANSYRRDFGEHGLER